MEERHNDATQQRPEGDRPINAAPVTIDASVYETNQRGVILERR